VDAEAITLPASLSFNSTKWEILWSSIIVIVIVVDIVVVVVDHQRVGQMRIQTRNKLRMIRRDCGEADLKIPVMEEKYFAGKNGKSEFLKEGFCAKTNRRCLRCRKMKFIAKASIIHYPRATPVMPAFQLE